MYYVRTSSHLAISIMLTKVNSLRVQNVNFYFTGKRCVHVCIMPALVKMNIQDIGPKLQNMMTNDRDLLPSLINLMDDIHDMIIILNGTSSSLDEKLS